MEVVLDLEIGIAFALCSHGLVKCVESGSFGLLN